MTTNRNNKSGFTLVELMIVAAIIAILAAVVIPLLANNRQRAIAAEGQNLLGVAASACKIAYAENGTFPSALTVAGGVPQMTVDELGRAKYFGPPTITTGGLGAYVLSVTADDDAGDLSGKTLTLDYAGTWGGDFVNDNIIKP